MSANWSEHTDFDTACRRAAGRRRYNAKRQAEADERYGKVKAIIWSPDGRKRGTQAELARAFGVHRSTICRDVAKWRKLWQDVMQRYRSLLESKAMTEAIKIRKLESITSNTCEKD